MTKLCPRCGSGKTRDLNSETVGLEMDPEVECMSCGWYGKYKELLVALPTKQEGIDPNFTVAESVAKEYLRELAKEAASHLGMAMVKSGLVGMQDKLSLSRLIKAACLGAHRATLEEIEKIQKELRDGNN